METYWYILYTEPKREKKVTDILAAKKFEYYCPLKENAHSHKEKKKSFEPLFFSYVFVKASRQSQPEIRKINGIINFVYWLNEPVIVPDKEIDEIKRFLSNYTNVRFQKTEVKTNITEGVINDPAIEYEGNIIFLKTKTKTVNTVLPSLGYIMIGEMEHMEVITQRIPAKINSHLHFNVQV